MIIHQKEIFRTGEMTQQLITLTAMAEDMGLIRETT